MTLLENSSLIASHPTTVFGEVESKAARNAKLKVVSLFAGCGGMDLGFIGGFDFLGKRYGKHPFEILWANELNPQACRTYAYNVGAHIHCGDIWEEMDGLPSYADVVIGGFPCQDISVNGKGAGVDGARSGLYRAMVEVVQRLQPKVFVAENVKGLLMKHHAKALHKVVSDFMSLGYHVNFKLYNSASYGVPQTRERVIIVGTKVGKEFEHPAEIVPKDRWVSARSAIDDLKDVAEDEAFNHVWSRANRSPEQGDRRLSPERPGYTIRAECHGNIQWHYSAPRRISMREAARIQSFPDSFSFRSKLRQTERQIGNAVPPVMAWHIAKAVRHHLRRG